MKQEDRIDAEVKLPSRLRIGTRDSQLAIAQTEIVADFLRQKYPQMKIELIGLKTTGDRLLGRLDKVGGKGLFVKELDQALRQEEVDITVHSLKDMPTLIDPELPIIAYSERVAVEDVLVLPKSGEWDLKKPVGTSSQRRGLQFLKLCPEAKIKPIRGNIITRLKKLESENFAALILARAGLERLGLAERIAHTFSVQEMIPAAGQGVLAVQARADFNVQLLEGFNCQKTEVLVSAERAFIRELDGGCSSATCCHARFIEDELELSCLYSPDNLKLYTLKETCSPKSALDFAKDLARELKRQVAADGR